MTNTTCEVGGRERQREAEGGREKQRETEGSRGRCYSKRYAMQLCLDVASLSKASSSLASI